MIPCVTDILAVSASSALGQFHRWIQLSRETDSNRNLIRDKLRHKDYKITGLAQIYSSAASGKIGAEMIESRFELPPNPVNPDLYEKPAVKEENPFGFMENLAEGKLAQ